MSGSSDDDIPPSFIVDQLSNTTLRRTKLPAGSEQFFYASSETDTAQDKTYPISNTIQQFYEQFQSRPHCQDFHSEPDSQKIGNHSFLDNSTFIKEHDNCYITPELLQEISIPIYDQFTITSAVIFYLDISSLNIGGKKHQANFNHSWRDISQYTSVEAQQIVDQFLKQSYESITESKFSNFTSQCSVESSITSGRSPGSHNHSQNVPIAKTASTPLFQKKSIVTSSTVNTETWTPKSRRKPSKNQSNRIFHYIGLGLPPPVNDKISFDAEAQSVFNYVAPFSLLIIDCDKAATLQTSEKFSKQNYHAFFACSKDEVLRIPSTLPQNLFTCILLTPAKAFSEITKIAVKDESVFHQLLSIFTQSIALECCSRETFYSLFRNNSSISTLWKRFFLAQRLMHTFGLHSRSYPELRDTSENQLWYQFEYALMSSSLSLDSPSNFTKATQSLTDTSIFLTSDPLFNLSHMYFMSFNNLDDPPSYVTAFIASLMELPSINLNVLQRIAQFMSKSPKNCYTMAKVLNHEILLDMFESINHQYFADWCCVFSGLLLASSSFSQDHTSLTKGQASSSLTKVQTSSLITKVGDNIFSSTSITIYLLSIIVSRQDLQPKSDYVKNNAFFPKCIDMIYKVNPILREWIILFIHSFCRSSPTNNEQNGPLGLHSLCSLLLFEKRQFTRAASLSTLLTMFDENSPSFNDILMNCALKAAIDGSSIVRRAFLYCLYAYKEMKKLKPEQTDNTSSLDSIEDACHTLVDDMILSNKDKWLCSENGLNQKLDRLLEFCLNDPNEENRKLAQKIHNDDFNELNHLRSEYEIGIHRMAHTLLFIHEDSSKGIQQRYGNDFFEDDEIEMFDLIDTQAGPISAISFDFEHKTFCAASENGDVVWGSNHWKIGNGQYIQSICPLRNRAWAALSRDGIVYILHDGNDQVIDSFRPSIQIVKKESQESVCQYNREKYKRFQDCKKETQLGGKDFRRELIQEPVSHVDEINFEENCSALCSSPDSPIIFISSATKEILAWDIEAFLLVGRIEVESPPKFLIRIVDKLYAALNNGVILQIGVSVVTNNHNVDEVNFIVENRNETFKGQKIVRIGKHKNKLFSVSERGPLCYCEHAFEYPKEITDKFDMECFDYLVHPFYPVALKIQDTPTLLELYQDAPIELVTNRKHCSTCCCFDDDNPLCAIGYDDGYVSVWRIKKPANNQE